MIQYLFNMEEKQRTNKQNRALHKLFKELAQELNENGLDMRRTLKPSIDIQWDTRLVKEYIWRPLMQAQLGKDSTTQLTTKDIDKVFETINKHFAQKFGLQIDFPSIETIIMKERLQNG